MSIQIDADDFERKFDKLTREKLANVVNEIDKALLEGAIRIEADAVHLAPEHDGELIQNIGYKENHISVTSRRYTVYSNANHSAPVEFGTSPHFTSPKNLKKWAKDKLGDENLAFAVARKIARYGTKAQPFFRPAFYKNEAWIEKRVRKAVRDGLKK